MGSTIFDKIAYKNNEQIRQRVKNVINSATVAQNKVKMEQNKASNSEAMIQKSFELFKYRDIIPLLQQTIISVLPNEKTNPAQREIYKAFDAGNGKAVMSVPRNQRKQVFITGMSIYFSDNIGNVVFGQRAGQSGVGEKGKQEDAGGEETEGIVPVRRSISSSTTPGAVATKEVEGEAVPGFVVTITGYSPYKNIGELMDPVGIDKDPNKWGVVTRLLHLNEAIDGNSPFELFRKMEISNFKLETGDVSLSAEMPRGIGVLLVPKAGVGGAGTVLTDPMTREVISKVPEFDEYGKRKIDKNGNVQYKVNDHWFKLDCKFKWKGAPKLAETSTG